MAVASDPILEVGRVVRLVYQECDQEYTRLRQDADADNFPPTVCSKGCAGCCSYVVNVADAEAMLLAEAVQTMPPKQREATLGRLEAWRRLWRSFTTGREAGGIHAAAVAWGARRIPCPLLDPATHTCSVYAVRPHACRTHHACQVTDPPPTEEHGVGACQRCTPRPPGEGCFFTSTDVGHSHHPIVWQIRADLQDVAFVWLCKALGSIGIKRTKLGLLPMLVLEEGQQRYGWPRRPKSRSLQPMTSTYPIGDPRRA